jgi:hypothetical protein
MTTENLFINNCCHWEAVKAIRKGFPKLDIIPPLTYNYTDYLLLKTAIYQNMTANMEHMRRKIQD